MTPSAFDQADRVALLQERLRHLRRVRELARENGVLFYAPHDKQDAFHRSTCKRRAYFSGNRGGKSTANAAETAAWAIGERSWYPETDPARRSGIPAYPTKQLILTTDWDKVDEIWTTQKGSQPGKLWRFLPKSAVISVKRNHSGAIETIEVRHISGGASIIRFDTEESFKRNAQGAESSDWDRVAVDEPITADQWKAASRGLIDRNGQGDFTLTPLREMWIYDYFYGDGAALASSLTPVAGRFAVRGSIFDNPHLTTEAIAEYERDLTDDEKQARLYGIPLELSGLVYKEFQREKHVLKDLPLGWRDWHLPGKGWILYARVDPHPQTPHAVLFCAVGQNQIPILCHEIWMPSDAEALADAINAYVRETGLFLADIKVDPAAWVKDSVTRQTSIGEVLASKGLLVSPASKDKSNGILNMRSVLKADRGVRFVPTLRRTLWEISRYCYDKENKPVDRDDHMMENMYRMFITQLPWFDPDTAAGVPVGDMEILAPDYSLD